MSFFILPMIGTGTRINPSRPKYVRELGVSWTAIRFGTEALVWTDTTDDQAAIIKANGDAILVPPLDNVIDEAALATVQEEMSDLSLPSSWVQIGMTHREVLRTLIAMGQLTHRISMLGGTFVIAENLDKQISELDAASQVIVWDAIDATGEDKTAFTIEITLGDLLYTCGQQFKAKYPVRLGDL